jgi:hypothetical protein
MLVVVVAITKTEPVLYGKGIPSVLEGTLILLNYVLFWYYFYREIVETTPFQES